MLQKTTTTFKSQQTRKPWKIFHNKNCKTKFIIWSVQYATYSMRKKMRNHSTLD